MGFNMQTPEKILIIGAGPTGLGAAWRLQELHHENWTLIDASPAAGGLSSSVIDHAEFTWDLGGHVVFSHYAYFDELIDKAMQGQWIYHNREAWVWMNERFIPYPLQHNVWQLPNDVLIPILESLVELHQTPDKPNPSHFKDWLLTHFGAGLCDAFMFPYNFKVWGYKPEDMSCNWCGERVAAIDLKRTLRNLINRHSDITWGPNATFRFPSQGGTGSIWRSLASMLPSQNVLYSNRVTKIDPHRRIVLCDNNQQFNYDKLITTTPLDLLLTYLVDCPTLSCKANQFRYSSTYIFGIGIDEPVPDILKTKCWMYFPEEIYPFYRVTVFSNYAPSNVPRQTMQYSLMAEVCQTSEKPVDSSRLETQVLEGLYQSRLIRRDAKIASVFSQRLEHGYPTPFQGRDELLSDVQPKLEAMNIFSRGRFGGWRYEVSNQDHSVMQGVEIVNRLLLNMQEMTYTNPNEANRCKHPIATHRPE
jgi:protoporphyrinogen oxidase